MGLQYAIGAKGVGIALVLTAAATMEWLSPTLTAESGVAVVASHSGSAVPFVEGIKLSLKSKVAFAVRGCEPIHEALAMTPVEEEDEDNPSAMSIDEDHLRNVLEEGKNPVVVIYKIEKVSQHEDRHLEMNGISTLRMFLENLSYEGPLPNLFKREGVILEAIAKISEVKPESVKLKLKLGFSGSRPVDPYDIDFDHYNSVVLYDQVSKLAIKAGEEVFMIITRSKKSGTLN